MCVLSIKVPIRKKSGNIFNDPCIKDIRKVVCGESFCFAIIFTFRFLPFGKGINPFIFLHYGLNISITVLLQRWHWH